VALADDFILNVRQILQYQQQTSVLPTDGFLLQTGGLGGPYGWATFPDAAATAMLLGGYLNLAPNGAGGIAFNGAVLGFANGSFEFTEDVKVPSLHSEGNIFVNGNALATQIEVTGLFDFLLENTVSSFNGRTGEVQLETDDVLRAGGAPIWDAHFGGHITAPTPWDVRANDDTVATTSWVQQVICQQGVRSFMCRHGDIVLTADDVSFALTQPGVYGRANTPPAGDASNRIATTLFCDGILDDAKLYTDQELLGLPTAAEMALFAPIDSPQFTGIPTAPTAAQTVNSGQLATTAFVHAAVTASTTGVASFNTRTGAVLLTTADVTGAGGATLASPAFTGNPTAPTQTSGDSSTRLATTAFVAAAVGGVAAGVTSFNTRTGSVTLQAADLTAVGGALLASPTFSGLPSAPTPAPTDNTTRLATTQYVTAALAALPAPVSSFNGRTGAVNFQASDISAVGGALLVSPNFTGNPTAPTQAPGSSDTKLATTAFVAAAVAASVSGVSTFNGRSGAVTLVAGDLTAAGGALLASPTFTGVPAAPTATAGTNSAQLATTAFVQAALSAAPGGVSSFNSRTGAITLLGADVSAAGGALNASPAFTGNPTAPTPNPGDNDTSIATTAFVQAALASAGGVNSFNGRAGAVTLNAADVFAAAGAIYRQAATPPATASETLWFDQIGGQLYVQYVDPTTSAKTWVVANQPVASGILYSSSTYPGVNGSGSATTTAATFTTPANSSVNTIYKIRQQAAGGGGGAVNTGSTMVGSAGGGGEFKEYLLSGVAASTPIVLAVGNGGAGGVQGVSAPGAGGATTLSIAATSSSIVCTAGGPGINVSGATFQYSGKGGDAGATTAGTATVQMIRQCAGGDGANTAVATTPPVGGTSAMGVPSVGAPTGSPANGDGGGYGTGGAGAWTVSASGHLGRGGVVMIERIAG
jgi:hypothetical protein